MKFKAVFVVVLLFWVFAVGLYVWVFRHWVELAYQGTAPAFFNNLINDFYPRFAVEKHRFPLDFFLSKADQIFWRGSFVVLLVGLAFFSNIQKVWKTVSEKACSIQHVHLLRILFYSGLLFYTWDWIFDLQRLVALNAFYKPILLFQLLHLPLPAFWVFGIFYGVYILSVLCAIFKIKPFISSVVAATIFTWMLGYFFSFEKIDHGYATLLYAVLLMPFLIAEAKHQHHEQIVKTWGLAAIQAAIAGAYFMAGLEKVFTSGFSWATAHTFRTYLILHQAPLGLEVAKSDFLCTFLPWMALLFQLGFILIVFFPKLKYIFIPGGIAFHAGTVLLFNIGVYFTPWIFVYIFFINWDWINKMQKANWFKGGVRIS